MLRHFHGPYSHRPKLLTNQRPRIRSVIVKIPIEHADDINKLYLEFLWA